MSDDLASFDAAVWAETLAKRLAMWELMVPKIVSVVPSSDTLSLVVRPANRLNDA